MDDELTTFIGYLDAGMSLLEAAKRLPYSDDETAADKATRLSQHPDVSKHSEAQVSTPPTDGLFTQERAVKELLANYLSSQDEKLKQQWFKLYLDATNMIKDPLQVSPEKADVVSLDWSVYSEEELVTLQALLLKGQP